MLKAEDAQTGGVEGKISGDLDSDFDLTHLEDKIRAQRIKD